MIAGTSKPLFAQNERSSAVVVESSTSSGTSPNATRRLDSRWNRPSSTVPDRS